MKELAFFLIISFFISNSFSQSITNYGAKIGINFNTQFIAYDNSISINEENGSANGFDCGIFAETHIYKKLSLVGTLQFIDKGITNYFPPWAPQDYYYFDVTISDRYQYLSLQTLGKYSFINGNIEFYGIIGPRFDVMIHNYYDASNISYNKIPNFHFEFGGTLGLGLTLHPGILLEFQYNPNFTRMIHIYNIYYNSGYSLQNSSYDLFIGFSLK